jgi:glycosyltransferase involved in cell wall biosynthesis
MKLPKFSVLISTYINDNPQALEQALASIINQSLVPTEIVLVIDGLIKIDTENVIANFKKTNAEIFKIVRLETNLGLGNALKIGLENCSNELIARMDSDDIAVYDRFKIQVNYLVNNENVVLVGSNMEEFNAIPGDLKRVKAVPSRYNDIKKYAKYRNPINHPTAVFRKNAVQKVGSYTELNLFEDYYLWIRMLKEGFVVENINQNLLFFRVSNETISRRHGLQYLKKEVAFFSKMKASGFLNSNEFYFAIIFRLPMRLLPLKILSLFYAKYLR